MLTASLRKMCMYYVIMSQCCKILCEKEGRRESEGVRERGEEGSEGVSE